MIGPVALTALLVVGAVVAIWRISRWRAKGWPGLLARAAGPLVVLALAAGAWALSLSSFTHGTFTCLECGRTEEQERAAGLLYWRTLVDDGAEYAARFLTSESRAHAHDWHLESCLYSPRGVSCTLERVERWFRTLPRLRDRAAADELYREAQALERRPRCRLMNDFGNALWRADEKPGGLDAAFAEWNAKRR